MTKALFVTGTGTDVGKTFVAGLIVKKLNDSGRKAAYFKAAASGNERGADGRLIPGDSASVLRTAGLTQSLESTCPFVYERPYSPHLAARVEGNPPKMSAIKAAFKRVADSFDFVTVEGSGGIVCPIGLDEEKIMLEDVVKELGIPTIVVAGAGLGTINSVVLTVEYMRARQIPVKGVVFNRFHPGDVVEEDNVRMCERLANVPTLALVRDGDAELTTINDDVLAALYEKPTGTFERIDVSF